jgi:integrase/recombinase XerD
MSEPMTGNIQEFLEHLREDRNHTEETIEKRETAIKELRSYSEGEYERVDISDFLGWLSKKEDYSTSEIRNEFFKAIYEFYEWREWDNPCSNMDRIDVVAPLLHEDISNFLYDEKTRMSKNTVDNRLTGLTKFDSWLKEEGKEPTDVDWADLRDYILDLKKEGYSGQGNKTIVNQVGVFYSNMEKRKKIEENPMEDIDASEYFDNSNRKEEELREDIYYIEPEEVDKLVENVPQPELRNKLIIGLLFQTGVRRSELVNIRVNDVDRGDGEIRIHSSKTDDRRWVYYKDSLEFYLTRWLEKGRRDSYPPAADSAYLFVTNKSEQMNPSTVNNLVKKAAENAGIQEKLYEEKGGGTRYKITAHTLRHSFAVHCVKNDMPVNMLSDIMGHSSIETTQQYLKLTRDDERKGYEKVWE